MSNTELIKTYATKIDLQGKEGYAVVGTTDAKISNTSVVTLAGLNAKAVGVIVDGGLGVGTGADIQIGGFVRAMAGSAITAFAELKVDANGAFIPATVATDVVVAIANEPINAGAKGEIRFVTPRLYV